MDPGAGEGVAMVRTNDDAVADAPRGNWVDRFAPAAVKPYARLARWDRPIGWWLLLWPCWWSAALAAGASGARFPDPWHLVLFLVGAIAMRGAGCTYNDIVDRKIDAQVARTRSRPIPSGQVSARQAGLFLVLQALVGSLVLQQFNRFTFGLGLASLLVVAAYPFAKRVTHWPQAVLGLAFSWGGLMGWAAVFGRLDLPAVLLYLGAVVWTIGYDTIYAHQDREDDALVGIGSTALLFGRRTRPALAMLFVVTAVLMGAGLWTAGAGVAAFVGFAAFCVQLGWQVVRLDIDDPDLCLAIFKSNSFAGWLLFLGLVADCLARQWP
ncbi:4-hydroxybenzoate octaprenyltransferase [Pseudoxanthobacter soli]